MTTKRAGPDAGGFGVAGADLSDKIAGIGARIRFMRRQREMSLDQLGTVSGLTKSYLSKVERGLSVPSISTAMKVADGFGVSIGELLGAEQGDQTVHVVRKSEREAFMGPSGGAGGYNYELLSGGKRFKTMEPFIMRPPFEFEGRRLFEHRGEEFIFVLSGEIEIEFPARRFILKAGDSIYFESHLPHRSRSVGAVNAEVLVVVTG
ncbi:helix-turn-helix transcriptional regulator [bacterium SCSIO 12827]|nr:helix-turn-helix transcriptional regulator [bacterium SCSIO 12827]